MFCICAEHGADNIEMFLLLLISVYTEPRPCRVPEGAGDTGEMGRGHSQDRRPQLTLPHDITALKGGGKKEGGHME